MYSYQKILNDVFNHSMPLASLTGYHLVDMCRLKSIKPTLDIIDTKAKHGSCTIDAYLYNIQAKLLEDFGFKVKVKWDTEVDDYSCYTISWK